MTAIDAYADYERLGDQVVIVGGGEIGMETAIFLAQKGKNVTVLEMRRLLAMDSTPIHYYSMFREEWAKHPGHTGLLITRDGTHPTEDGYRMIAGAMVKAWRM